MKVGINARTFDVREPGGAVLAAKQFSRHLSELEGTETLLFGNNSLSREISASVDSTLYRRSQLYGLVWERTVLPVLARRHDVDLLFAPNGNAPLHRTSVPTVMLIHDVNAQHWQSSSVHGVYRRATVPRAAQSADHIVTVSDFSKREITDVLQLPEDKISVVPNGIRSHFFCGESTSVDGLPADFVLFVGSISTRKNVDRLVSAFRDLETDAELVFVGPSDKTALQDVSVDIDNSEDITHLGYVTESELKYVYEQATVLAYPSVYEGFGLPPLEAMACGTPVVTAGRGPMPDIYGDGAFYVDPRDTEAIRDGLDRLLRSSQLRETLRAAGKDVASQYTWEATAQRLHDVFSEVVEETTSE